LPFRWMNQESLPRLRMAEPGIRGDESAVVPSSVPSDAGSTADRIGTRGNPDTTGHAPILGARNALSGVWNGIRTHYALYPFLAMYSSFVFYEIIKTLQTGMPFGGDPGSYLFTAVEFLHGRSSIFSYEYPLLPAFYTLVVLSLPNGMDAFIVADLMTGVILSGLFVAGYLVFLRDTSSKIGGLVGAVALATIPLFMDEAGWGGQAQLVAIVLGILAVRRFLAWGTSPRLRDGLAVGALIGLAALSEGWTTFYFVILLAISAPLEYRRTLLSRKILAVVGIALVPVLLVYGFLYTVAGSNVQNGLSAPWILYIATQHSALGLAERFAVNQLVLLYAYVFLAILWVVVYCLRIIPGRDGYRSLLLPAMVAFAVQALFLTSIYDSDRGVYFAAIPLALVFARLGGSIRPSLRNLDKLESAPSVAAVRPYWQRFRAEASAGTSVLVIVLLGLQVGFSGVHLTQALTYYSNDDSELSQLTFLRNQSGGVALVGMGNMRPAVVEYAVGNPVYSAIEPTLLVNTEQRESAVGATLLQEGPRWIDAGGVRVADASGAQAEYTPGIFDYTGAYLLQTFWLNDALLPFAFSPVSNHSTIWGESPYFAPTQSTGTDGPNTFVANYSWNTVSITKKISVDPSGSIHIDLDFQFINSFVRGMEVRLFANPGSTVGWTSNASGTYSVGVSEAYGNPFVTQTVSSVVMLQESNISLISFQYVSADQWGLPELQFQLSTPVTTPQHIQVNLTIQPTGMAVSPPTAVTENQWFQSLDVHWVVVPIGAGSALLGRLQSDPNLHLYRTTAAFEIFQTELA
jgi:hypothetical protein